MRRTTRFFFAAAAFTVGAMGMGCEVLTQVDRSNIPDKTESGSSSSSSSSSSNSSSSGTAGMGGAGGAGGTAGMGGGGGMAGMGGAGGAGGVAGAGGTGGGMGGAGGGGMTCNSPTDCPPTMNECIVATCNGNVCGTMFVGAGTPTSMQTSKDCKANQCDGAGTITTVNDDADVPDDQNDCTIDACKNGVGSNMNSPAGTMCGAGMAFVCDGAGKCGCNQPTDCAGTDTECRVRTCMAGACGFSNTAQGTVLQSQTSNDCKTAICDGMGNTSTMFNGSDLPADDGNPCTVGACDMATMGPMQNPVSVDDSNACTTDACDPMTGISHTPVNTSDNNACTTDACDPMTGVSHTPVNVNDNDACTADACDPMTGVSHTPVNTSDNNACTTDACDPMTGVSHTPVNTSDNNACTTDACDPMTGVSHTPVNTSDNNACTTDACDPMTGVSHTPVNTNDNDACTADACDPMTGVSHTPVNTNDNNACTADACDPMTGVSHTPVNTNDNNACTADACDPMTGVSHTPVNVNDNNACTTDACDTMTGTISHNPVNIDDNNACTADACDPMTGVSHTPVNVNDNNACTTDACDPMTGTITHIPVNIDDSNACTTDACDMTTGVSHTPVVITDNNACTTDACDPMTGVSHTPITIDDMVACTIDSCDMVTGESHITVDSACGPLNVCDLTGCVPAIPADQVGNVIITEFAALGTEFMELYNPTASPIDIRGYVVKNSTSATLSIRSASDPMDTMSTPVTIPANGYVWGVKNPANPATIPMGAAFVMGAPGATLDLADTGDVVSLYGVQGFVLQDTVNFTQLHTNPNAAMAATAFPGVASASTQVDPTSLSATGNDSGANWCTTFYPAPPGVRARVPNTSGAANGSCKIAVINEALIDTVGTDDGKTFVEIAGPGGALAAGMKVTDIEGVGAMIGTTNGADVVIPAGVRIPVDGFLIVADETGTSGTTQVAGVSAADVISNDVDFENNGGDAIQLISANNTLLDALGHSAAPVTNFTSNVAANGLAMYESQVVLFAAANASLARNATSADTDNNGNDFHGDPSATPGAASDNINITVASLSPDDGLANIATTGITVLGTDFTTGTTLAVGGNAAAICTLVSSSQMTCTAPTNAGTVARVGVTATNPVSVGSGVFALPNSFTYTGVLNETSTPGEADFCNVQFPATFTVTAGQVTPTIYGRIFEDTVTQPAGAPAGVLAELGYGPAAWTPLTQNASTGFLAATFNIQVGNDDEFQGTFVAPAAVGMYRYVYRFSLDGGLNYTYCDTDGAGSNMGLDFNAANSGVMTVQ